MLLLFAPAWINLKFSSGAGVHFIIELIHWVLNFENTWTSSNRKEGVRPYPDEGQARRLSHLEKILKPVWDYPVTILGSLWSGEPYRFWACR